MKLDFQFQTLICVYMPLGTWAEVKVHSYHALTHVCVGSYMCCSQAMPLSKLQYPPPPVSNKCRVQRTLPFGPFFLRT